MSYARMGRNSDVYVLSMGSSEGITCMSCRLTEKVKVNFLGQDIMIHQDTERKTPAEMIEHLKEHVAAGHKVPKDTFKDLERDIPLWET